MYRTRVACQIDVSAFCLLRTTCMYVSSKDVSKGKPRRMWEKTSFGTRKRLTRVKSQGRENKKKENEPRQTTTSFVKAACEARYLGYTPSLPPCRRQQWRIYSPRLHIVWCGETSPRTPRHTDSLFVKRTAVISDRLQQNRQYSPLPCALSTVGLRLKRERSRRPLCSFCR